MEGSVKSAIRPFLPFKNLMAEEGKQGQKYINLQYDKIAGSHDFDSQPYFILCICTGSGGEADKNSSDEMDTSRTQRRFNIYINSVKEFLSYFKSKNNLLTVDTSCGDVASVWDSVCNYVVDSEISKPKGLIFLYIFSFTW